jgi:chaperonin cofactor prefoldin
MSEELKLRDRVAKLEQKVNTLEEDQAKIAKALHRTAEEIGSEWGEEIIPSGTRIAGVEFEIE